MEITSVREDKPTLLFVSKADQKAITGRFESFCDSMHSVCGVILHKWTFRHNFWPNKEDERQHEWYFEVESFAGSTLSFVIYKEDSQDVIHDLITMEHAMFFFTQMRQSDDEIHKERLKLTK
jgi:hypothetical protein